MRMYHIMRGAVSAGFELVINLLALVGTFNGSSAFVSELPLLGSTNGLGKQAKVILAVGMEGAAIFGGGTITGW